MPRAVASVAAVVLLAVLLGCGGTGSAVKPIPREEFRARLMGKTEAEVLQILGRPKETKDYDGVKVWSYDGFTFDPVTDKQDRSTTIRIDGQTGKIVYVGF